jgi:hypothetical protein
MSDKNNFIFLLLFLILLSAQHDLHAATFTNNNIDYCDNLLTSNQLHQSEIDSAFTSISYFPDQDATKTQHTNHYPLPPETPRNDNILHIFKDNLRYDDKKLSIQRKHFFEYYSVHSPPQSQPPGNYNKPITSDVLRI